ncbi:hypothetical protein U27_03816 [Candidatus Vecturithrix granuli]|uniref:Tetratricopeptide repeat protein n=1 Tax=Vecturithrix granuli TaxID=1499967 RepID=A0A081BWZ7_VECG1|nr:hypothetical protein U27_03816 [Candidatus Vecturithrix granuli]
MSANSLHVEPHSQLEELSDGESADSYQHPNEKLTLPIVGPQFVEEEIPPAVTRYIATLLEPGESIFVLFRLNSYHTFTTDSGKTVKAPLWTVVTGVRLLLVAVSVEGDTYSDSFDQQVVLEYQNGFGRDAIKLADKSLSIGLWEVKRRVFKEVVNLFPLSEYEKYLYFANLHLKKEEYLEAIPFLRKSLELEPTIKASLLLTHTLAHLEQQEEAFNVLNQAYHKTPAKSLIEEIQLQFPDDAEMLLYLAAVSEDRRDWDTCIECYILLLQKTPDFDLYFLKLGEMYNAKQEYQTACEYYQKFIHLRQGLDKSQQDAYIQWDMSDFKWFSADPDLVKAYFDLGLIYEYEAHDYFKAASTYLALLRHAPFYRDAYKHFWLVYQQLCDSSFQGETCSLPIDISLFLQIYKLLAPEPYASTVATEDYHSLFENPQKDEDTLRSIAYQKMVEADQQILIHPREQDYWYRIQHWMANLVISEGESEGIEEFCEQVGPQNFPELAQLILQLSDFLDVKPPKCFISRGKIGINVKNREHPFIFIGSEHLNPDNERYFSTDELVFIIAAQLEHIKSGHFLVTDTDLWKSLGTASFDSFLMALQCLPAGGFLGKITHQFATAGLKKVYKMTRRVNVQKILDFFSMTEERSHKEDVEFFEENGKGERSKSKKMQEPESLLKAQIVDFARHAVYTADRTGLLACHNFEAASAAIFKLASSAYEDIKQVHKQGLVQILKKQDNRGNFLYFEYAKRFGELIRFALSENYWQIHSKLIVLPEKSHVSQEIATIRELADNYHILINKLQILAHSMQNTLLTPEEFLRKQKNLVTQSGLLQDEDLMLVDKLQQAYLDEILTTEELHYKLFSLLEMRHVRD